MLYRDRQVSALRALCEREGGYRAVAAEAKVSADNLWQILNGTLLPSGTPRGIGARLAKKLDIAFPGWMETQHRTQGLGSSTVAQNLSLPNAQTVSKPVGKVPVIGTLVLGTEKMYELKSSPDGEPIGFVPQDLADGDTYAVQIFGDELYPAVRHGACLVIQPGLACDEGELILLETHDGYYLVSELVTVRADAVTVVPAVGGTRTTLALTSIRAMHPVVNILPGSRLQKIGRPAT